MGMIEKYYMTFLWLLTLMSSVSSRLRQGYGSDLVCIEIYKLSLLSRRRFYYNNLIKKSSGKFVWILSILMIISVPLLSSSHYALAATTTGVIVPLYTYPDSTWDTVAQAKIAHPSVPVVAIINPNNGPGSSKDANYVTGIQKLHSAGVVVLGYVYTGYGSRSANSVNADIDTYKNWYSLNGIFFDEMSNAPGDESHYYNLSQYAKSQGLTFTVGNPGTDTLSSYIGTVDNIVIYETGGLPSISSLGGWYTNYDKSNFSTLSYGVGTISQSFLTSESSYVGYTYITNDNLPNPWDSVPPYFATLVADLDTGSSSTTAPQPPTGLTATAASSSQISLSWTAPTNNGGSAITGYKIESSTNSGSTWSVLVSNTGSTGTAYSDTGLSPNTTYSYRVSAINSVGTSTPSNTASATTQSATTSGNTTTSSIVLNGIQSTSGTVSSAPYQITLSNFNAGTGNNRLLVVGVEANNSPVTSVTFGGVQLTSAVSSFYNNDVEFWYLTNPSGTGNIVVTMTGSTSVVVGAYSISGVNQTTPIPTSITNHNTASSSPTISITTKYPNSLVLDSPSIYSGITLSSPTCTQSWNINMPSAITGASSSTVPASASSVTCRWTTSGGGDLWDDVAIEVKASGSGVNTTTNTATAPQPPTGLTATAASSSQISLSWTAPTNNGGSAITGYKIYRSNSSGTETGYVSLGNVTSYTNTGLAPGVTYFYKVRAVNFAGVSPFSNEASATPYSITLVQSGLAGSDSLTNETRTKDQLLANQRYWTYGGSATVQNAPYDIFKDSQGLHIGVRSLSNGNYSGFYGVTPDTSALLFHSVITTFPRTVPNMTTFYENGLYVQTSTQNVNYVTCYSDTSFWGTVWAIASATGDTDGITQFHALWYDKSPNQPLTRDCTIITNGQNYLKVYLDGVMVYSNSTLNLQMPGPFNAFLEPQTSYDGQMLYGIYKDYYSATDENVKVSNLPTNAATVSIVDSSGNILATAPITGSTSILDVGKYHLPLTANIKIYDSSSMQIASTQNPIKIFGGDVYSVK